MPAEWEEHDACLIGWTCRKGLWPEEGKLVRRVIMNVIRAISQYEKVLVVAREGGCWLSKVLPRQLLLLGLQIR